MVVYLEIGAEHKHENINIVQNPVAVFSLLCPISKYNILMLQLPTKIM